MTVVEVFRTDVCKPAQARRLVFALTAIFPTAGITFDLEDCDRVLRIEGFDVNPDEVISFMEAQGFSCGILS